MSKNGNYIVKDLIGASKLAKDAIAGITEIVESRNPYIKRFNKQIGQNKLSKVANDNITKLIAQLDQPQTKWAKKPSLLREANLAMINGLIGDYLAATDNPLAIEMSVRKNGKTWDKQKLIKAIEQSEGHVNLMVHGLTLNDLQWKRKKHDHGALLQSDLGILPIYLHYNTGLHVSENGRKLSEMIESIIEVSSVPLKLNIITHSLGGLVARSACYYGEQSNCKWTKNLQKVVFLGTPHNGALAEKAGNWMDTVLNKNYYGRTISRIARMRSSAFTDIRYGYVVDEDWKGKDRFADSLNNRTPVPLPEDVECYAIATTTSKKSSNFNDQVRGDGMVTIDSALGIHREEKWHLNIPQENQWIGRNISHMDLLCNPEVYSTIKNWLKG